MGGTSAGPQLLPVTGYLDAAAQRLLSFGGDDLSRVQVLVSSLPLAAELRTALAQAAGRPTLLPRFDTLRRWASAAPLAAPNPEIFVPLPESERLLLLHGALAERQWFDERALWGIAAELAALADELSSAAVLLPDDLAALRGQLEKAYALKGSAPLAFEARIVHEMWHVLAGVGRPDAPAAYRLRLSALARSADCPLFVLLDGLPEERLSDAERAFLERYAERQSVEVVAPCPRESGTTPLAQVLAAAWPAVSDPVATTPASSGAIAETSPRPPLRDRARELGARIVVSPLAGRLSLLAVSGREAEAEAAAAQVFSWLGEGLRRIALVAEDRLTARRVRALLERQQVLVADETGWKLTTTRAAATVDALLECAASGAYHRDLLDLLKSPHLFADVDAAQCAAAVHRIELAMRRHGVRAGIAAARHALVAEAGCDRGVDCASDDEPERERRVFDLAQSLFDRVEAATIVLRGKPVTLVRWLARLRRALGSVAALEPLAADAAGAQVLALIDQRSAELERAGSATSAFAFSSFRDWLDRELDAASFRDRSIASSIVLLPRHDTRLRRFEAALVIGADAAQLSPAAHGGSFFNQAVRRELCLPSHAEAASALRRDLELLLQTVPRIVVTWQAEQEGEARLLAPEFERLSALHGAAWGDDLRRPPPVRWPDRPVDAATPPGIPQLASPAVRPSLMPQRISVSALASLVACPYQFFVRSVLRLGELDEVSEALEKSDYGALVHRSLERFHRRYPVVSELSPATALAELDAIVCESFAAAEADNWLAVGWRLRWQRRLGAYLEWQRRCEAEGWRWQAAEEPAACSLALPGGGEVTLYGRIDRIDRGPAGERLIDYKTKAAKPLRDGLAEDVQLPAYALLRDAAPAVHATPAAISALYLALDEESPVAVDCPGDVAASALAQGERLVAAMAAMQHGAALPAHGVDAVCRHCPASGLCRRDHVAHA